VYDEIFQLLFAGGDILLLEPILDLCFGGVVRWNPGGWGY
jgi:hypothetical protein